MLRTNLNLFEELLNFEPSWSEYNTRSCNLGCGVGGSFSLVSLSTTKTQVSLLWFPGVHDWNGFPNVFVVGHHLYTQWVLGARAGEGDYQGITWAKGWTCQVHFVRKQLDRVHQSASEWPGEGSWGAVRARASK